MVSEELSKNKCIWFLCLQIYLEFSGLDLEVNLRANFDGVNNGADL